MSSCLRNSGRLGDVHDMVWCVGGAALSAHRACVICDFDCVEFVEVVLPVSAVSVTLDTGHCATGHAPQCPECGEIADAVESFFIL